MIPIRTFLALPLPKELTGYLFTIANQIKDREDKINWVKRTNIHITLNYLGDTDPGLVEDHARSLEDLIASYPSFKLGITDTGIFPHANDPKVLWVGAAPYDSTLTTFKNELNTHLKQLGYHVDYRKFQPHITLGRVKSISRKSTFIHNYLSHEVVETDFEVSQIKWYKSTLTSTGAIYEELKSFNLSKGDPS